MPETVAVFPLPKMVAFPGQKIPLHIFEPRYRKMIETCLEKDLSLGVCPPKKVLRKTPPSPSIKKAINSNHDLYLPETILSCGKIEIKKILSDGRYLLDLKIDKRIRITNIIQNIPFYLAEISEMRSQIIDLDLSNVLYKKLLSLLFDIFGKGQREILEKFLVSYEINKLETLLVRFFEIGILPVSILQKCLEIDIIEERAKVVIEVLGRLKIPTNEKKVIPRLSTKEGNLLNFPPSRNPHN